MAGLVDGADPHHLAAGRRARAGGGARGVRRRRRATGPASAALGGDRPDGAAAGVRRARRLPPPRRRARRRRDGLVHRAGHRPPGTPGPGDRQDHGDPAGGGVGAARGDRRARRRRVDHRRRAERDRPCRPGHRGGAPLPAAGRPSRRQPQHGHLRPARGAVVHGPGRRLRRRPRPGLAQRLRRQRAGPLRPGHRALRQLPAAHRRRSGPPAPRAPGRAVGSGVGGRQAGRRAHLLTPPHAGIPERPPAQRGHAREPMDVCPARHRVRGGRGDRGDRGDGTAGPGGPVARVAAGGGGAGRGGARPNRRPGGDGARCGRAPRRRARPPAGRWRAPGLDPGLPSGRMDPTTTGLAAPRPLPVQRELFDIPDDVAYFNCANLAPQLESARTAAEAAWRRRARPWLIRSDDWFTEAEERRTLFARLAGVDAEGVALVPATSYGLAVAAANLTAVPGQRVLVLAEDYPSNFYTWQRFARRTGATVAAVDRGDGQTWAEAVLDVLDERTAVVAVAARARAVGAAMVVDASQALGAMPLDLAAVQPDYLVSVGYKWLLGPFGLGYLYVAPQHRDGVPLEENWISRLGAQDFARLVDYEDRYQPGARRFDVGQRSHFETTSMAIAALRQLLDWGVPRVAVTLRRTTDRIEEQVRAIGLTLTSHDRGPHMLGIRLPAPARQRVAAVLAQANVFAGVRGASLRISPHLWTTDQDVGRLVAALTDALDG